MSNEFKDLYNDFTETQKKNYELCMKHPILVPTDRWTGETWEDYMFESTELDNIPLGWKNAFGEQWAAEVQEAINKMPEKVRETVRIMDLKEKWGFFNQDFSYYNDELDKVISKYERLSERICIMCGAPATKISRGWVSPFCDVCAENLPYKMVDIDEWFKEDNENGEN